MNRVSITLGTGHLLREVGGGGATKREGGGHVKWYPYEKGGLEKVLVMLEEGGHKMFWGILYVVYSLKF